MKNNIEVVVFEEDLEDGIPTNPKEFMLFWQKKINLIPEDKKEFAKITIDSKGGRDYCFDLDVKIVYTRMETDEEQMYREDRHKGYTDRLRINEINELKRLQKRYPDV